MNKTAKTKKAAINDDDENITNKPSKKIITNNDDENSNIANSSAPVYRYKDIDFDNAEVSELNKEGRQPLAYINYNDPIRNASTKILVQTGKIKITSHGIPQLDDEGVVDGYYPDDSKREFIKIPLDDQPACIELRKHIEAADEWAGSAAIKKKLFGKRADEYQFQPSIKTPKKSVNDDDKPKTKKAKGTTEKKEYPIIDYVKMKFNVISQGKIRVNKTKLKKVEGKTKTTINAVSIAEIANEVRFLSENRFVFYYNKIWANKSAAQGATKIVYGLGFKVMAIEYTPSVNKSLNPADIDFLSSEEEEEPVQTTTTTKKNSNPNSNSNSNSKVKVQKLDDSDVDENPDDDKDEVKNEDNEADEDNEDENDNPKKRAKEKNKKSKKVDEDQKEEEIPVKRSSPKKTEKKSKKAKDADVDVDADENEADDEIKAKKRSGKGKSSSKRDK
jgi:hypothetical protein